MLKAITFGIAAGAGFQAWRNYPGEGPASAEGLFVLLLVAVVCAFGAGLGIRRARGPVAVAQAAAYAAAKSEAASSSSSTINLAVVVPGGGARPAGVTVPTEALPWMGEQRAQVTADQLDGLELSELLEQHELEGEL